MNKENKNLTPCILWNGYISKNGYGHAKFEGKTINAHRAVWQKKFGKIPMENSFHGTCVLHKCDNRACVNLDHLFLGTQKINMQDCACKGRAAKPFGESNPATKLNSEKVFKIREKRAMGKTFKAIAIEFGISLQSAWDICSRRYWKHI
jgi:hypothetical protein